MQKFIIWVKINWLKISLLLLFVLLLGGLTSYSIYIFQNFQQLETFSKKQIAGMQAMQMPMLVFAQLLTLPFMFAMYYYLSKGGGLGTFKVNALQKGDLGVSWDDIIGMDEAKKDAREVVQLLKDHSLQSALGGNIIKGTIMIGPPGCGKTYLAKAMANECGLPMLSAAGSEFVAMFMGQGASRMKSLFKQARELAKIHNGCIIFIDEIDAFARERAGKGPTGIQSADISYNATINQFLTELDGLRKSENNVVVIAATNVPEEELDPAIMRSGRFDRKIRVEKPNARERAQLLKYYLSKFKPEENIDIEYFADKSKWFSPSDVNNLVREAGVIAVRHKHPLITTEDLKESLDRIMISIEKMGGDKILSEKINVRWDDIIGMTDIKQEAWEMVKLLKDRNRLKVIGGKIVKGAIMFGPPGCGKTYLAKAIATESGFPFIAVSGSELVGIFVGEGAKKMKDIFKEARAVAKSEGGCIIFFDEIDAFATPRTQDRGFGGQLSHNATINQFLTELDGLRQQENTIFVLAATNVKESDLDPAVIRAGRIERKMYVKRPNVTERKAMFEYYLSKVQVDPAVDPGVLARTTIGFTPSDIDNMVREAGLLALRDNSEIIKHNHFSESYDRLTIGSLSNKKYSQEETIKVDYHEAGHALVTYLLLESSEPIKATIRPRKDYLGYIYYRPTDDFEYGMESPKKMMAGISVGLAGFAAEKIIFGTVESGVWGDFQTVMKEAKTMVWEVGMGRSGILGNMLTYGQANLSEKMKQTLEDDVQDILRECVDQATEVLTKHRDVLEYFAQELLKKGDLEYDEIQAIFEKFNLKPLAGRPPLST